MDFNRLTGSFNESMDVCHQIKGFLSKMNQGHHNHAGVIIYSDFSHYRGGRIFVSLMFNRRIDEDKKYFTCNPDNIEFNCRRIGRTGFKAYFRYRHLF